MPDGFESQLRRAAEERQQREREAEARARADRQHQVETFRAVQQTFGTVVPAKVAEWANRVRQALAPQGYGVRVSPAGAIGLSHFQIYSTQGEPLPASVLVFQFGAPDLVAIEAPGLTFAARRVPLAEFSSPESPEIEGAFRDYATAMLASNRRS